jgi:hypothetical protein
LKGELVKRRLVKAVEVVGNIEVVFGNTVEGEGTKVAVSSDMFVGRVV